MAEQGTEKIFKDIAEVSNQVYVMENDSRDKLVKLPYGKIAEIVDTSRDNAYLRGVIDGLRVAGEITRGTFRGEMVSLPSGERKELDIPTGRNRLTERLLSKLRENG